jgi:hypothetical protein
LLAGFPGLLFNFEVTMAATADSSEPDLRQSVRLPIDHLGVPPSELEAWVIDQIPDLDPDVNLWEKLSDDDDSYDESGDDHGSYDESGDDDSSPSGAEPSSLPATSAAQNQAPAAGTTLPGLSPDILQNITQSSSELMRMALTTSGRPRNRDLLTSSQRARQLVYIGEISELRTCLVEMLQHSDPDAEGTPSLIEFLEHIDQTLALCAESSPPGGVKSAEATSVSPTPAASSTTAPPGPSVRESGTSQAAAAPPPARVFLMSSLTAALPADRQAMRSSLQLPVTKSNERERLTRSFDLPRTGSDIAPNALPASGTPAASSDGVVSPAEQPAAAADGDDIPSDTFLCAICYENRPINLRVKFPCNCGGSPCQPCFEQTITHLFSYNPAAMSQIQCPGCGTRLPEESVQESLPPEMFRRLQHLQFLMVVRANPERYRECPSSSCSRYVLLDATTCQHCGVEFCSQGCYSYSPPRLFCALVLFLLGHSLCSSSSSPGFSSLQFCFRAVIYLGPSVRRIPSRYLL